MSAADQWFRDELTLTVLADGYVTAEHPMHGYVGELLFLPSTGEILNVEVEPEFQRKGVATLMYNAAKAAGINLTHSEVRSDEGDGWARSIGGDLPVRLTDEEVEALLR
jgi:ribosomal protein S18 acetylase RimI-like enzyme